MAEGRGERTIGSGHLVALFLGIVVLCCVFFILGYEMGRAQFEKGGNPAVAAKPVTPAPATAASSTPSSSGWPSATATGSVEPAKSPASAAPAKAAPAPAKAAATPARTASSDLMKPPDLSKGGIVLQVLASKSESDSLNLAKILQEKGFPAFVLTPSSDGWYRVQVGPFPDAKAAEQAKTALAQEGFKAFVKR